MSLELADHQELQLLAHRYATGVDAGRFDEVAALFVPGASLVVPAPPKSWGPTVEHTGEEIVEALRALESFTSTRHVVGTVWHAPLVEPSGPVTGLPRAVGRVLTEAHHVTADSERPGHAHDLVWHLRYDDRYVHVDGAWSIERRELRIEMIEQREVRIPR